MVLKQIWKEQKCKKKEEEETRKRNAKDKKKQEKNHIRNRKEKREELTYKNVKIKLQNEEDRMMHLG